MEREKTLGVLGGLGPETTSHFNLEVTNKYKAYDASKRPQILSWYTGMDHQLEEDFVERGLRGEEYIPYLVDGARRLEAGGADFIAIPCNTVHVFIDDIRSSVSIPVLSIIEESEKYLQEHNINAVGILATPVTVSSRLYHERLEENGIEVVNPTNQEQEVLGQIISRLVNSKATESDREFVEGVINNLLKTQVSDILLACTDFQLIIKKRENIHDTMDILAQSAAQKLAEK